MATPIYKQSNLNGVTGTWRLGTLTVIASGANNHIIITVDRFAGRQCTLPEMSRDEAKMLMKAIETAIVKSHIKLKESDNEDK